MPERFIAHVKLLEERSGGSERHWTGLDSYLVLARLTPDKNPELTNHAQFIRASPFYPDFNRLKSHMHRHSAFYRDVTGNMSVEVNKEYRFVTINDDSKPDSITRSNYLTRFEFCED